MNHLQNLGLTDTATMDEVKSAYRSLAKKYHPDLNKDGAERFRSLTTSYEWLLKNHVPKKPTRSTHGYDHYYKILGEDVPTSKVELYSDSDVLENGAVIYFMRGMEEFRVFLEKGERLPKTVQVTNLSRPFTVTFVATKYG